LWAESHEPLILVLLKLDLSVECGSVLVDAGPLQCTTAVCRGRGAGGFTCVHNCKDAVGDAFGFGENLKLRDQRPY